jgi:hypothetical protein
MANLLARRVERYRLCGEDVAFGIHQLDQHLVRAARHAHQDDGAALAEIRPQPRQVVDGDVQMPDARRHIACSGPGHRLNAQVFHPIRDVHHALGQRTGKRRLYEQAGRRLVIDGDHRALGESTGGERSVCGRRLDDLVHCIFSY